MGADVKLAEDALIVFTVKDRDLFGISNQYLADCFITMAQIASGDIAEQKDLALNRPQSIGQYTWEACLNRGSYK